jgi:hypothetical protein
VVESVEITEETMETKLSNPLNPKDAIATNKIPMHLWPSTATAMGSLALLYGARLYGRSNWREAGVRASVYVSACQRHLAAWYEGEDFDRDSGLPHLAHALACLAILVDADAAGKLKDDRQYPGGYRKLMDELTPLVAMVNEKYKDRPEPRHYDKLTNN